MPRSRSAIRRTEPLADRMGTDPASTKETRSHCSQMSDRNPDASMSGPLGPWSHRELNTLFKTLDRDPVLISAKFEGWLVWPLIKERLWRMHLVHGGEGRPRGRLSRILARLILGIVELAINFAAPAQCKYAALYSPRKTPTADGRPMHPHLGMLLDGKQGEKYLRFVYDWENRAVPLPRRGVLNERLAGSVPTGAAMLLRRNRAIQEVSHRLASHLAEFFPGTPEARIQRMCADQLARFAVRRRLWQRLFKRAGVRSVLVLDPDAKTGEIAAAKLSGIPVVEMQHGMFSADEPDYSWTAAHRRLRREMAVADRVLVFGPYWQRELAENGFWLAGDVACVGCAGVAAFRPARTPRHKPSTPCMTLLFPTQSYVREAAVAFWLKALSIQAKTPAAVFRLRICVHPAEKREAYDELVHRFPGNCEIADASESVYLAMVQSDVVVGYTSLAMMEAVGMGVPTVSIRGGAAPDGLCGTFADRGIGSVMPHLDRPEELMDLIMRYQDPVQYREWAGETSDCGAICFTSPPDSTESRIERELETAASAG